MGLEKKNVVAEVSAPDLPDPEPPLSTIESRVRLLGYLKRWDFDTLSNQFTSDFTLQILSASSHLSPRTNSEYIESLHTLRDSLNGTPLEVCFRLDFGFTPASGKLTASKDDHI